MNKVFLFILLATGLSGKLFAQKTAYQAGFRVVKLVDSSRLYKPNTDASDYLHYRPIDLDVWYPARVPAGSKPVAFKYFLEIFGKRANYYTNSNAGDSVSVILSKAFSAGFNARHQKKSLINQQIPSAMPPLQKESSPLWFIWRVITVWAMRITSFWKAWRKKDLS